MQHDTAPAITQLAAPVIGMRVLSPEYYLLRLHAPAIARAAQPGQFAMLRPAAEGAIDPLLGRPISIYRANAKTGDVDFIFKVVGRGTAMLAETALGETITVLGPIGNGFRVPEGAQRVALVGGGVGMPPLYFLAQRLKQTRPDCTATLFYGGRSRADLLQLKEWSALGVPVQAATDDGSFGHHGLVTAPLQAHLAEFDFLVACGPKPMLRAVQRLALDAGLPGQLSLEERMACGVGACLGCVCATVEGKRRICVDGPVFALEEVEFHA